MSNSEVLSVIGAHADLWRARYLLENQARLRCAAALRTSSSCRALHGPG